MDFPKINSVFLHVTNSCNCSCRYCFEHKKPNFMPFKVAKDTVDFLIRNSTDNGLPPGINFFGGEPLLCWDSIIVPLTNYIRKDYGKPFELSMTSNCTLMTEERLKFMQENGINLLFSIDGDKETQDYNRPMNDGRSSFDTLSSVIDLIPAYFQNVTFRSTAIPETCHNVFHNIMFAEKHGYNNFFVVPDVFQEWSNEHKEILKNEIRKYTNYFIDCFQNNKSPIKFSEYDKSFQKITHINNAIKRNTFRPEESCGPCAKCGLSTSRFGAVDYRGDIYSCQEFVSSHSDGSLFRIGNLYRGIDENARERLQGSYNCKQLQGLDCQNCKMNRICDGGCIAHNYACTGDINRMPPMFCWWLNLILDEAIYVCNKMGDNPPPLFLEYWRWLNNG